VFVQTQWAKSPKKSEGVRFLLIRHSKYSAQKYTPTDCVFGDFAYWGRGEGVSRIWSPLRSFKVNSRKILVLFFQLTVWLSCSLTLDNIWLTFDGGKCTRAVNTFAICWKHNVSNMNIVWIWVLQSF